MSASEDTEAFAFGDEEISGEPLWEADFSSPGDFRTEVQSGDVRFEGDRLRVDTTADAAGATVWATRAFPADVLVTYRAACAEPDDDEARSGRNFNCFLAATGPDGDAEYLAETERSGAYGEYHELPNYIFTLTYHHTRMRRDPGFDLESDLLLGAQPDHAYEVAILKRGDRLAAAVDGRKLHDWTDPDPHGGGWVGLRTWNTDVTYEDWAVYEPR
jgi:hypothetical protein